jgi:serine/threonine protein kinase
MPRRSVAEHYRDTASIFELVLVAMPLMTAFPVIPGYELIRTLGGGPMTEVFVAQECQTNAACALKALRQNLEDPGTGLLLLRREALAGLTVRHPNLLAYIGAHILTEPYFLVTQLLFGESLRERLCRAPKLDVPIIVGIARQIASALASLHRKGFLHGDLKPDNIVLLPGNGVRIIDLGSAHRPGENKALLEQGYIVGTPDYLAPELCAFQPETNGSSDLFSLGVVLFEMLAGTLPYPRGGTGHTLRCHRDCSPDQLPLHAHPLPVALVDLTYRLLESRPASRPSASAVELQLRILEGFGSRRWVAA